ncbi:TetR/AcrR family transcriptional regulator [Desertihabitans aurantiacus]|uniref:TetR/AcrR family transcriptional regulator n=1 Tax=Desertihabitans aurantiacus TaxID=2282477 RepID=UPI001E55C725|nr:TetR/AcrR family transcriptional regulator [Desertihabitans aurantiacus]
MPDRALRADAADNRERILQSARRLLVEDAGVGLNVIARTAGVGQGTLYRHFPNRTALVMEVYRADVEHLGAVARELLRAADTDAPSALRRWFDEVADYARVKHGVLAALSVETGQQLTGQHSGVLSEAVDLLLEAGRQQGVFRGDVGSPEVLLLLGFLSRVEEAGVGDRVERTLDLIVDGLLAREDRAGGRPSGQPE